MSETTEGMELAAGQTISGEQARTLGPGAVVRWTRDRTAGGLRLHTPYIGWVPAIGGGEYEVVSLPPNLPPAYQPPAPRESTPAERVVELEEELAHMRRLAARPAVTS